MNKDIIFYSNYCTYSKEIINQISKTKINDNILYISVDDDNIELPPFIKAVPTIYLVKEKKIVTDESIAEWIKEKLGKPKEDTLQAYFGSNDSSYASSFSTLDESENKPYISAYTFLGDEQQIETPEEDDLGGDKKNKESNNFGSSNLDMLQQQRNSEFQSMSRR